MRSKVRTPDEARGMMKFTLRLMSDLAEVWLYKRLKGQNTDEIDAELISLQKDYRYYERRYRKLSK